MGFELSETAVTWIKSIAAIVAVLTAYGAKGDSLRGILNWFKSATTKDRDHRTNMDVAWRELMDDSRERNCTASVHLLNEWMECRTMQGMKKADDI